jgi:hypothetical protein
VQEVNETDPNPANHTRWSFVKSNDGEASIITENGETVRGY